MENLDYNNFIDNYLSDADTIIEDLNYDDIDDFIDIIYILDNWA